MFFLIIVNFNQVCTLLALKYSYILSRIVYFMNINRFHTYYVEYLYFVALLFVSCYQEFYSLLLHH